MLQIYSIITYLLYTLQSDHHHKSWYHLSPYHWSPSPIWPILNSLPLWEPLVWSRYLCLCFCFIVFVHLFFFFFFFTFHIWVKPFRVLSFSFWLVSLSVIPSKSIHVVTDGRISFFLCLSSISTVYMYHGLFIHLSTSGHLDCFYILIITNTAIYIEVHISFWINVLVFSG